MTASVSPAYAGAGPSKHTGMRIAVSLIGLATIVVGVVLLFNPVAAAHTLALLIGLAFVLGGLLEIGLGWEARSRGSSVVLGGILIVAGFLAMFWPGVTLWTIALITGLSLMAHGIGRIVLAVAARHELTGWLWLALAGAFGVLFGILAIAWPAATVLVLSLILGAQITIFGVLLLAAAFLPSGNAATAPSGV
jgi:uncharacterized membrane protein HdeD (DUF308 family)